jgi:hypothetical protein
MVSESSGSSLRKRDCSPSLLRSERISTYKINISVNVYYISLILELLEPREQKSHLKIRDARIISVFITGDLVSLQIVTQWKNP